MKDRTRYVLRNNTLKGTPRLFVLHNLGSAPSVTQAVTTVQHCWRRFPAPQTSSNCNWKYFKKLESSPSDSFLLWCPQNVNIQRLRPLSPPTTTSLELEYVLSMPFRELVLTTVDSRQLHLNRWYCSYHHHHLLPLPVRTIARSIQQGSLKLVKALSSQSIGRIGITMASPIQAWSKE